MLCLKLDLSPCPCPVNSLDASRHLQIVTLDILVYNKFLVDERFALEGHQRVLPPIDRSAVCPHHASLTETSVSNKSATTTKRSHISRICVLNPLVNLQLTVT